MGYGIRQSPPDISAPSIRPLVQSLRTCEGVSLSSLAAPSTVRNASMGAGRC